MDDTRPWRPANAAEWAALAREIARRALAEDLGAGDLTTSGLIDEHARATGVIRAKQAGVLSGLAIAHEVFRALDREVVFRVHAPEGARVSPGMTVATAQGRTRSILSAERAALNVLQHLSGIATLTARFVEAVAGTGVAILDTRKTTPGLRAFEKLAVTHGGGVNHRFGLDDAILIKENHVAAVGDFATAIARALAASRTPAPAPAPVPVIVEAHDLDQVALAARSGVTRILLDNFTPAQVAESVAIVRAAAAGVASAQTVAAPAIAIEVSGGITLANVKAYALPGVDCISIGALTHSAPALDLSLDLEPEPDRMPGPDARR